MRTKILTEALVMLVTLGILAVWISVVASIFKLFGVEVPTLRRRKRWLTLSRKACISYLLVLCASFLLFTFGSDYFYSRCLDPHEIFPDWQNLFAALLTAVILGFWGFVEWDRMKDRSNR